ncbi:hypothetical protein E2C01_067517 [Portunus trituberculatus]|uniref:Uncharacterized protein n=1 Tax=Portunus trituberculatus TaxID=210409 RepID=A0A5B7HV94_PORTR|nr:hypothetical protein [Portunus trituberculatus]
MPPSGAAALTYGTSLACKQKKKVSQGFADSPALCHVATGISGKWCSRNVAIVYDMPSETRQPYGNMSTCRPATAPWAAGLTGTLPPYANDAMTGVRTIK